MELNSVQEQFIEQLYIEMYRPLSAYAQSALRDKALAEEAVQDTFRIACSRADKLMQSGNPEGWIMSTLKYVIQNTKRTRARLNQMVVSAIVLEENDYRVTVDERNPKATLKELVGEEDYHLLELIAIDGYSLKEAATELGISVEACKKRFQRAKKNLKDKLEEK